MLDLDLLGSGGGFSRSPGASTRLALINQSCRSVKGWPGSPRQRFETHFPGLGLLSLAHSLRADLAAGRIANLEIGFFDEEGHRTLDDLEAAVKAWLEPAARRVIGASTYTYTIGQLCEFMRRFDPTKYLIMLGGAHATTAPDIEDAHIVVRGEGATALRHVLTRIFTPEFGTGEGSEGLCYQRGASATIQKVGFDRSLETAASPAFAYDLLPPEVAYSTNFQRLLGTRPQIYVCTQSCRARCTFCSTYLIHGRGVARPIALVREDLRHLVRDLGHDSIEFHDDDLMQHPDFFELVAALGELGVPWFCYARASLLTREAARTMRAAGCRRVFLGIESMQQAKLDYFNKQTTVEQNRLAVTACAEAGIGTIVGFIIGAPADTVTSVLADLDTYLELPLFALNPSVLSPDPGTVEFGRARQAGGAINEAYDVGLKRLVQNTAKWGFENPVGLPSVCEQIGKRDLNQLRRLAICEFYFRPHVWQQMCEGKTADQIAIVAEWYDYLKQQDFARLAEGSANREIDLRVRALAPRVAAFDLARGGYAASPPAAAQLAAAARSS